MLRRTAVAITACATVWWIDGCAAARDHEVHAASVVYVRTDTDATTIVSPTVQASGKAAESVDLNASYTVDAWSGASIDVVSAATHTIRERRQEGQVGLGYDDGTTRLNGRYRLSYEHDYQSHGLVVGASRDVAKHNTTLSANLMTSFDIAGRAGDKAFAQDLYSVGLRLGLSQTLDPWTVIDLSIEATTLQGYQASPYRWVAVGGDGVCAHGAPFCLPELVPDDRLRSAAGARLRHAVGERASFGLDYRFYLDSWSIQSHTVEPSVTVLTGETSSLAFHYRYYAQSEASFYRPRYFDFGDAGGYLTRDRKLSAFYGNEVGVAYGRTWELEDSERVVELGLRASLSRLTYLAYVGLDSVDAAELTTLVGLTF